MKATALKLELGDVFEEQQGHQRGVGGCRKGNPPEFGGSSAQGVPRMHCEKRLYVVGHALPSSRFWKLALLSFYPAQHLSPSRARPHAPSGSGLCAAPQYHPLCLAQTDQASEIVVGRMLKDRPIGQS